jgi:phenylacetate-CoA ligase
MQQQAALPLRLLLLHARHNNPYWATRLPALPDNVTDARQLLSGIPLLTRGDLRRERLRLCSTDGDPSTWRAVRTTGTTGEPVEVVVGDEARRAELQAVAGHVDRCLGAADWRRRDLIHLTLHAGARSGTVPSPLHEAAGIVKWNLQRPWQAGDTTFLACLRHLHGQVVTAMPSVIELLADRIIAAAPTQPVVPLLVVLSGEQVDSRVRALVDKAFGCPVTSLYTLAEAGVVASECSDTHGYHVEERAAVVEIVDENGEPAPPGSDGEVVVTPLQNRAMPLLRYRTGDRGRWADQSCDCGQTADLLYLVAARRPSRLVATSGGTVNVVRFAKLLAGLAVERVQLSQAVDDAVTVTYWSERLLDDTTRALIVAALRCALGPGAPVRVRHASARTAAQAPGESDRLRSQGATAPAEPDGPEPHEIAAWLRHELRQRTEIELALITGSSLDPEATTRFSDVDLVLLVSGTIGDAAWTALAGHLRGRLPRLRVNVDHLDGLSVRAPLLACRLLNERLLVLGELDPARLPWPTAEDLQSEARFWRQGAGAVLFSRLVDPGAAGREPLREAWIAARHGLDALRYHYLLHGERETAARAILSRALRDRSLASGWLADLAEAFDVAREHRPPPPIGSHAGERYLAAALASIRTTAAHT